MQQTPLQSSSDHSFETALSAVSRKVHRAQIRNTFIATLQPALKWLWCIGMVYCVLRVAEVFTTMHASFASWTAIVGVVLVAGWLGAAVLIARKRIPDIKDVAERLDLAISDTNAIATAISLSLESNRSPMALMAIRTGKEAISVYGSHDPVVTVAHLSIQKSIKMLGIAALIFAVGVFVPQLNSAMKRGQTDFQVAQGDKFRGALFLKSSALKDESGIEPHAPQMIGQLDDSANISKTNNPSGVSVARGSPGRSERFAAAAASASMPAGETLPSPIANESVRQRDALARDESQMLTTAPAAGASVAAGAASAASRGDPARSAKGASDIGSRENGSSIAAAAEPPSDDSRTGAGDVGGPKSKKLINSGQGPKAESGTTLVKGSGRTSGDDAAKKSRGVAPLILGTPRPDLLLSRQLVGPDARIDLKMPSRLDPQSTATAATAPPWTGDEPMVDTCRVPALARQSVSKYFEQYHQIETP